MLFFSNALHHHQQADYIPHEYSLTLSLSRCLLIDDVEQGVLNESTEWHHSIIHWISHESSDFVRRFNMTSTNTILLQCSSPPPTSRSHTSRILTLSPSRCLLMMILNRSLESNQLNGTIPSSIGSLVNLEFLYVNPT